MPTARLPIDITWTGASGSPGVNVFHARTGTIDPDSFEAVTSALEEFYQAIAVGVPGAVTFRFAGELQGVGDDEGEIFTEAPWTVVGLGTDDFLPPASAVFINWRAASGGRSGRGRTYLSPLGDYTLEDNGTPTEEIRAAYQAAADALIEDLDSVDNGALGIWSRTELVFRDFVTAAVPNKFASLRSRRD